MQIDSNQWRQIVIDGAGKLGVTVTDTQARMMGRHAIELLQWNRSTNLTSITDPVAVAVKHVVDAVASAPWIGDNRVVLDAGAGGGFPGIPLKIIRPDLSVTMVDSVRKKVSFQKYAIRTLGLTGIDAVHGRLEDLGRHPRYREKYDLAICRAFASLDKFIDVAVPFLSAGGILLAMKGPAMDSEPHQSALEAGDSIRIDGMSFAATIRHYRLPVTNAKRSLIRLVRRPDGSASLD